MSETARYPSLAGRVVFISGGASGIGEALVRAFVAQGAQVAFVDIAEAAGQALQVELGATGPGSGRCLFQVCDVTDIQALRAAIAQARQTLGPVAVLVNNAANDARRRIEDLTPEDFERIVAVNLRHQVFAAQAVRGLTRALARDLGPLNIRVNSLVPGWVMTARQLAHWVTPQAEREMDAAQCLPGRVQAEDVAQMALFLASDASRMCSAQDFVVDAGWS